MSTPGPNFSEPLQGGSSKSQRDKAKKRCWLSRSDEEIVEHMDSRNLPYRKGWPQLPPLPVSNITNGARNTVNNPEAVINTVQTLCQAQRIQPSQIYFAFRVPEVQQPGEQYHTLVVTADLSDDPILYSLIIQIRKYLQQDSRHQEISIEFIDHRVVHGLFSFAISPSEEHLLDVWQPVFDIVLEEIRKQKEQWITIEMLYRGLEYDAARCPATVVITSPNAAGDIWVKAILPDIHKRVRVLSPSLNVELLCGSSLQIDSQGESWLPDAETYQQHVPMGSSIGQRDLKIHSGTAGGMVKLSDGATFALTNHHVVRNDDLDNLLNNTSRDSRQPPFLKPGNPAFVPSKHIITCPSNEDNTGFIQNREKTEKILLNQAKNPAAPQHLASTQADLKMARTTDRTLGRVHASSGLRIVKCEKFLSNPTDGEPVAETGKSQFRFMLDWCLLAFHPGRSMSNFLPIKRQQIQLRGDINLMLGQQCSQWTVMNNPNCYILRDEISVGKSGRTTGLTYGKINPVPTVINPEIDGGQYRFFSKTYGFMVKDCGYSMSIITYSSIAVDRGDSGSIVLYAPSGNWLGLLFGVTSAHAALFTPIDLVFRDIEKVTGHKVVEPVFNPN
ncbi:Nn.00g112350.m01.CDS01 [Neocucurbitaria sp. VM-36]